MTRRTLILACSATKHKDPGRLQALDRYDGPAFRTLRANWPRGHWLEPPFILSAEHGLIDAGFPIEDYDRRMTAARADELLVQVHDQLERLELGGQLGEEILFFGGEIYRNLILYAAASIAGDLRIRIRTTRGGIGEQLGQLKAWLRRNGQ
jgi:hypothetical protein